MSLESKIAWGYLRSNQNHKTISAISFISILGLIISVMSLITILSVMNGFQSEVKNRILNAIPHAVINHYQHSIPEENKLLQTLKKQPNVLGASPFIKDYALLSADNFALGVVIRGIDPVLEKEVSNLLNLIKYGTNTLVSNHQIIIGHGVAVELGVDIGDKINLLTPNIGANLVGISPRYKSFVVTGIFDSGEQEYNHSLGLIKLSTAQILYQKDDSIDGINLKFSQAFNADIISQAIEKILPTGYYITHWKQQKSNLLYALNLEKNMIRLILFFIIAIAAFNLIAMMIMVVMDKRADIAILRTLGITPARVKKIFFYQSLMVCGVGISIGVILGVLLSFYIADIVIFLEWIFNIEIFPKSVFYLNYLPSELQAIDVIFTLLLALGLSLISSYYPAKNASNTDIATTLNHD